MTSKLLLFFLILGLIIYIYMLSIPVTITSPDEVKPNSFFVVTANKSGDWLVTGSAGHIAVSNKLVILSGEEDITIIYSPGLITKTIHITKRACDFTKLIRSWSPPKTDREAVATSLYQIGTSFSGDNVEDLIKLTRLNNQTLIDDSWKPFFQSLSKYCQDNMSEADLEEHKKLWIKIAVALRDEAS